MDQERKMSFLRILTLVIFLFLFSGCFSLTKELPPQKTYTIGLNNKEIKKSKLNTKKSLKVYEPKVIHSLNTKAMNYIKDDIYKSSYVLSKWSDEPSRMIQQLISSYLNRTQIFKYVSSSDLRLKSDYKLLSELISFEHIYIKSDSFASFKIRIFLIDNKSKKTYFQTFSYLEKLPKNTTKEYVITMNSISKTFTEDLTLFIINSLNDHTIK